MPFQYRSMPDRGVQAGPTPADGGRALRGRVSTAAQCTPGELYKPEDLQVNERAVPLGVAQELADMVQRDLDDLDDLVVVAAGLSHVLQSRAEIGPEDLG